ncbi:MAG TPA: class I SAM-dependent methyltransferase [Kofleriaceae bacterium]|nr:class I SAM-dependent methyltransferase [Kofleriaceae bacterium]
MLLKNLRPANDYDRFANETLAPWDLLFIGRVRQIARGMQPGTLVDIGTATAVVPVRLAAEKVMAGWRFIGVDLDPTMLDEGVPRIRELGLADRIELQVGDAQALPFADGSLAMSVSRATLHHLPDKALGLREMYRVLQPGGVGLVHDMRRDAPQAILDRFTEMRAAANYPPSHVEEKLTLDEARAVVAEAGLADVAIVSSPNAGISALGYEIYIKKPAQPGAVA